jgi:hypothetical protein
MAMDIGPVGLVVLAFPDVRADPATVEMLSEVVSHGYVTVLDLVFLTRAADGAVRVTDARDSFAGLGQAAAGPGEPSLISEDDLAMVRESIKPGTSAAVIVYEYSWPRRLAGTVGKAGGAVVLHAQVPRDAVSVRAAHRAEQQAATHRGQQQAAAESEAAVREAEAEAEAAERAAERYSTVQPQRAAGGDDVTGQLSDLARLRESGAISQAEFEAAKSRLLGS